MNIHEYQAKELLAKYGVPVPAGFAAMSVDEAVAAAGRLPGPLYVVKSQIHAGGRGKGRFKELGPDAKGGVRLARTPEEVRAAAAEMLGNTLVTIQTGPAGKQVNRLYVTDGVDIAKEFYLALLVDRKTGRVAFVVSTEGGMNIEEVAHDTPEKIHTFTVDPATGFMPHHGRAVAYALGLDGDLAKQAQKVAKLLFDAFIATDASQIEINPLAVTDDGKLLVLDAKVGFDSNAEFRHPDLESLRDESEEDPMELEASKHDLAYIKLDGNIGCMVNGAGLAMATMDIIKLNGAEPANFLDVGGGASKEKVTAAFKIILSDPTVEGILVNIFGGIMRCDIIAEGIVEAAREIGLQRAAGGPARRDQCRGRQGDPRRQRPRHRPGGAAGQRHGAREGHGGRAGRARAARGRDAGLNFLGNVEGFAIGTGEADVIVTDGFTGNVFLKVMEGTADTLLRAVRDAAMSSRALEGRRAAAQARAARAARRDRPRGAGRRVPARAAAARRGPARLLRGRGDRPRGGARRPRCPRGRGGPDARAARRRRGAQAGAGDVRGASYGHRSMTRDEVFAYIRAHLADELELEPARVQEGTRFKEDLEADSLDLYSLVQELEDTYGVKMSDEQAARILTVGQAVDFVLAETGS